MVSFNKAIRPESNHAPIAQLAISVSTRLDRIIGNYFAST